MSPDSVAQMFQYRLSVVRKARGLTQEQLSSLAQSHGAAALTRGALAKIESSTRHASIGEAYILCCCLDVTLDALCSGDELSLSV